MRGNTCVPAKRPPDRQRQATLTSLSKGRYVSGPNMRRWLVDRLRVMTASVHYQHSIKMMSSNGNIFRVIGPLWGESTGHRWIPLTKASDAELSYFYSIYTWTKSWADKRDACDLTHQHSHYDVTAIMYWFLTITSHSFIWLCVFIYYYPSMNICIWFPVTWNTYFNLKQEQYIFALA